MSHNVTWSLLSHRKQWSKAADESSHVTWHATNEVMMYEIVFTNITPRWQNIEMDVSRCGCVSVCSRVENRDQLFKTFHLSPYMTILWWFIVIMYFWRVCVYIERIITPQRCIFTLGGYWEYYSARWDLSFEVLYAYVHEKSVIGNFSTIKMYRVCSLYPQ